MGAVSVAHYLLVIVLIRGLVLSQTSFTVTAVVAAARLEPSSESGTTYNLEPARIRKDLAPPPTRLNQITHYRFVAPPPAKPSPPPPLFKRLR